MSRLGLLFLILNLALLGGGFRPQYANAANPSISEDGKKEAASDPEVVKEDVDRMKEDVINKKTQMLLFKQLMKSEGIESTYPLLSITHENEMSARYKVYSLSYSIDSDKVYSYYVDESQNKEPFPKETQVFKGPLVAGTHELTVNIVYKGNDTGVFSYINEYKIPVEVKKPFKIDKGQNLDIQVVGFEKGWALTDFKDRPDVKVNFNITKSAKSLK